MVMNRSNGSALVDEQGALVDTLSSRDLRAIGKSAAQIERLTQLRSPMRAAERPTDGTHGS